MKLLDTILVAAATGVAGFIGGVVAADKVKEVAAEVGAWTHEVHVAWDQGFKEGLQIAEDKLRAEEFKKEENK